jgi:LAGLIDADG-like domain
VHAYREVRALSAQEAAYLAGLIDGEGTVTLSRKHAGDMRQLVVSISNTELPILEFVLRTVGAGKLTHKCTSKANHSPSYAYAVWNRQALALLAQVEPYMRSYKGDRARLVLRDYVRLTPRNGKYTEAMLVERSVFEDALLALQAGRKRKPLQPCG